MTELVAIEPIPDAILIDAPDVHGRIVPHLCGPLLWAVDNPKGKRVEVVHKWFGGFWLRPASERDIRTFKRGTNDGR